MIIGLSTKFPKGNGTLSGKSTFFPEKIWQSIPDDYTTEHFQEYLDGFDKVGYDWDVDAVDFLPKKHTLRSDEKDRWKVGMMIHFFINVRTKNMFRFAPRIPVKSIQKVEVQNPYHNNPDYFPNVIIDGRMLIKQEIQELAINDGFDSVDDFFEWFNEDFTGKIIHWTDLKY